MNELKASFAGLLLIFILLPSSLNHPNPANRLPHGNNPCQADHDCSSSNCVKEPDDQYGIHTNKAAPLDDFQPVKCLSLGKNTCRLSSECCSNYCDIKDDDTFGICKASYLTHPNPANCLPIGNSSCQADHECCSNNCVVKNGDLHGICKNTAFYLHQPNHTDCLPHGNNSCQADHDCCTNNCVKEPDNLYGVCIDKEIKYMSEENQFNCLNVGNDKCRLNSECCSYNCVIKVNDTYGICKAPPIQYPNPADCLPLGNNSCQADYDCCSNNCVVEHDDLYGICKNPGIKPKSEENQFISEECFPLGNNKCEDDLDCCSDNCVIKSGDKFGVCKSPIAEPKANNESAYVDLLADIGCKPLGDNTCENDDQCCTSYCNFNESDETGVCETRMLSKFNGGTVDSSENPDSTNDIYDNMCKHIGNKLCESDHECCSHYCHKRVANAIFGMCEIPISSRYKNRDNGIYEKTFCTYYKVDNMTLNGEEYNVDEMTAAHWTLPFNTYVRVQVPGHHVAVRINNRRAQKSNINVMQLSVRPAVLLGLRNGKPIPCSVTILTDENCTPDFQDTCMLNHECCSRNCHGASVMEMGKCMPRSDLITVRQRKAAILN